jgi:GNAT superfamily N-acetyltransferase
MEILPYDEVDPLQVLHLSRLALDFAFTPEHAARIRRTDPRPFPCLTVNAVEEGLILGQAGVFRLPMISTDGREDVGGVWALSTHPEYTGRGIASCLLEEAHARMRLAGLRFSVLGTNRYRSAYKLYQKHGYVDTHVWATALARWETAHQPTRLRAEPAGLSGPEGYDCVEGLFETIGRHYLGFAWRHKPFARLRDRIDLRDIWVLQENNEPVGYVFAHNHDTLLHISLQVLLPGVDAAEAIGAVVSKLKSSFIEVSLTRPSDVLSLQRAGYRLAHPNWDAFMVKPLVPEVTVEDARRLFGIDTDRFLISWLDTI